MKCKRKLILFLLFPFFLSFPWFYGSSVRAEAQYTIYESELLRLEMNLQTLKQHSREKQALLDEQAKQLKEAQRQLAIANEQLQKSKEWNKATQNSLQNANQLLKRYEKEAERKIRIKARQRNLWIAVSIGLGILAMK